MRAPTKRRGRPAPTSSPPLPDLGEMHAQALASARDVTTRAFTYAQQLGTRVLATKADPPAQEDAPSAAANAMTQEMFGRLRDRSQRLVERLQATEKRIAARYDSVARSLVAKTRGAGTP